MKILWITAWTTGITAAIYYGWKLYGIIKKHKKLKLRSWQKIDLVTGKGRRCISLPKGAGKAGFAAESKTTFHARVTEIMHQLDQIENIGHYYRGLDAIKNFQTKYREIFPWLEVQQEVTPMIKKLEEKEALVTKPMARHFSGKEPLKVWL